ncbi:SusD/RagB family nutrient-binding outer membrane lipoprotein [Parapedobacter sp. 10938]|uniref:SusD/RagB family nutrient-binding outer membrane lipoprotein n=1 Tax=Parapedobacter flavus TaxID=3110225 RepID=UPI002DBEEBDF|nr:SusD/RagB family nutrient-binding outer membrane lipoprotein [Parapedobacter sp. 10938]MEC3881975.1 SusD/RagB family nutrient-binding outer membrane lipoprotein [Parapedobacter sp. 10938]
MDTLKKMRKILIVLAVVSLASCSDQLTETNIDPNVVDPAVGNPNMIMPTVLATAATDYLSKGWDVTAGVMQHIQHDGWFGGINTYEWGPENWANYYGMLRNNAYLMKSNQVFHQGVAYTMKAFVFGMITDLWGDAPYTDALKGEEALFEPAFDSQETIYRGILDDLQQAAELFATGDNSGYLAGYDTYYGGDPARWHKFANSLALRYAMRISGKLPDLAKSTIERVYSSGVYIDSPTDDATISYVGSQASNGWPYNFMNDDAGRSNFRRRKPAKTLMDQLLATNDPRLPVWWAPVHVQWVADGSLTQYMDNAIRRDGERLSMVSLPDLTLKAEIAAGHKFTRHFNPALKGADDPQLNTSLYVGVPVGLRLPDYYNGNPTPGQEVENQHVSQMSDLYRYNTDQDMLKARIISAAEVSFIFAEAALKGWAVGANAETHYYEGIQKSLQTWKVDGQYGNFIAEDGVHYNSATALEQIMTQKWVASWTGTTEAWMDFRRTGLPALIAGPNSPQPVLPVRFIYGDAEVFTNMQNAEDAIDRLEQTSYSNQANSQWAKPWIIQGTGKPW